MNQRAAMPLYVVADAGAGQVTVHSNLGYFGQTCEKRTDAQILRHS